MSPSFSSGGRNSILSSDDSPHVASQSGLRGSCGSNADTLRRDHGGGGGTGLHDGSTMKIGSSIKT